MKKLWKIFAIVAIAVVAILALGSCSGCPDDLNHMPWVVIERYPCGAELGRQECEQCGRSTSEWLDYNYYATHIPVDPSWDDYVAGNPATCTDGGDGSSGTCPHCNMMIYEFSTFPLGHDMVHVNEKEATCTTDGYGSHYACTRCDYTEGKWDYGATGHYEVQYEVEATCTTDGVTGAKYCTQCETFLDEGTVIKATGHNLVTSHEGWEATCMTDGMTPSIYCTNKKCDYHTGWETIPSTGHSPVYEGAVEATCTTDGCTAKIYCEECDALFAESRVIKATGHDFNGESCNGCDLTASAGFTYEKVSGGYSITGINGFVGGDLIIPCRINGTNVVEIADGAFANMSTITSVTLTGSVKKIGDRAFENCSAIERVDLGDSVTSVGYGAFEGCGNTKVYIYDFEQTYTWNQKYAGTNEYVFVYADRKDGMGLYESYLAAMNGTKNVLDRYKMVNESNVSLTVSGQTQTQSSKTILEMAGSDFYINYVSQGLEQWYYDGVFYQNNNGSKMKVSNTEVFASTLFMSASSDDFTMVYEAIDEMTYYRCTDGTYYCSFIMNKALIGEFFSDRLEATIGDNDVTVNSCYFAYYYDENGYIQRMYCMADLLIDLSYMTVPCSYEIDVTYTDAGTLESVTAPGAGFTDQTLLSCPHPYSYKEYVGYKSATCTSTGKESSIYCSACLQTVEIGAVIPKLNHEMVDGACKNCSYVEPSSGSTSSGTGMFDFVINEDGKTITITGIGDFNGDFLQVYDRYFQNKYGNKYDFDGMLVTAVAPGAFKNYSGFTSIEISFSGLIGLGAFEGCDNIKELKLYGDYDAGGSTNYIGHLFGASTAAENSSYIPASLTDVYCYNFESAPGIFDGIEGIKKVYTCADSVASLPASVEDLTVYEASVLTTGMFSHLVNLGKFTVINSVTEIQAGAFEGCDKLYVINNLSNLEIIKGDAVGNGGIAKNAVIVYCGSDVTGSQYYVYGDIIVLDTGFFDGNKRVVFEYIGNETELYITDGVNYFGWTQMTPNYTVTAIYLGDCVEYARGQAFEQFKALKTVYVMGDIDDMDISSADDFLSYGIELVVLGN